MGIEYGVIWFAALVLIVVGILLGCWLLERRAL